jgi:hypothetical protein
MWPEGREKATGNMTAALTARKNDWQRALATNGRGRRA